MCLPSPACAARVGEIIKGRIKIDPFGDNLQATCLQGDHWRRRHNCLVQFVHRACMWAGVPAEMEVFNLFSGLVRQEGLSRLERAQQRQSLVPDLRIAIQPQAVADAEVARDLRIKIEVQACSPSRRAEDKRRSRGDARRRRDCGGWSFARSQNYKLQQNPLQAQFS